MSNDKQQGTNEVASSDLLAHDIQQSIVSRAEWWRTNPNDPDGINLPVSIAMFEVANAINGVLVFRELERTNTKPPLAAASGSATDTDRLEWLMMNMSGKEARELGIEYSDGLRREHIDAAMSPNTKGQT